MIPTVFISSTVDDLRHIRDAVRATVEEVGYQPVMSEYGEIGYMGGDAAEDACYRTVPGCQLVVLIIGKRYGSAARDCPDKTITTRRCLASRKYSMPILMKRRSSIRV